MLLPVLSPGVSFKFGGWWGSTRVDGVEKRRGPFSSPKEAVGNCQQDTFRLSCFVSQNLCRLCSLRFRLWPTMRWPELQGALMRDATTGERKGAHSYSRVAWISPKRSC